MNDNSGSGPAVGDGGSEVKVDGGRRSSLLMPRRTSLVSASASVQGKVVAKIMASLPPDPATPGVGASVEFVNLTLDAVNRRRIEVKRVQATLGPYDYARNTINQELARLDGRSTVLKKLRVSAEVKLAASGVSVRDLSDPDEILKAGHDLMIKIFKRVGWSHLTEDERRWIDVAAFYLKNKSLARGLPPASVR